MYCLSMTRKESWVWFTWCNTFHEVAVKLMARVAVTYEGSVEGRWGSLQSLLPWSMEASVPPQIDTSIGLSAHGKWLPPVPNMEAI